MNMTKETLIESAEKEADIIRQNIKDTYHHMHLLAISVATEKAKLKTVVKGIEKLKANADSKQDSKEG
jgi:hypothetical protein